MDPLEARIQQLIDAGKSEAEIMAMKPQLLAESKGPTALGPSDQGPPMRGTETDWMATRAPTNPLEAQQRGLLGRAYDAVVAGGKNLREFPGKFADNPSQGADALVSGAMDAMMPGYSNEQVYADAKARAGRYREGTNTVRDDIYGMSAHGSPPGQHRTDEPDEAHYRSMQDAVAAQPGAAMFGGSVAPSPEMLLTGGLSKVVPVPGGALGRVGRSVLIGSGVAAASGTGRALARGESLPEALDTGAVSGLATTPLAAVTAGMGEAARATRNAVANSKGGQARQLIESEGGKAGLLSSGKGGPFAPGGPLANLPADDEGIAQASRASAGRILKRIEDTHAAEKAPATAELNRLDKVFPEQMVDASNLADEVQRLARHPRLSSAQRATVAEWERRMEQWQVKDPRTGHYVGVVMPAPELQALKGLMQDATDIGRLGAASVPTNMQRGAPTMAKELIDQTDYGPPNDRAHAAHVKAETQRRLLRLNDQQAGGANTPEGLPRTEVERVTNLLSRQGHKTVTSGGQNTSVPEDIAGEPAEVSLDRLAEQFPEHAKDVRLPRVLDAKGDLEWRFLPRRDTGGLAGKFKSNLPGVLTGLAAGGGPVASGHPVLAAILAGLGMGAANSTPAIQGRLLYTPAMLGGAVGEGMSASAPYAGMLLNPLMAAEAARKKKEKKR